MKKILSLASIVFLGAAFQLGCGSDDNNNNPTTTDSGTVDSVVTTDSGVKQDSATDSPADSPSDTPSDTPGFPAPPTLGDQIDRMGRPAINTATNHTFDTDTTAKNAAKDAYNQDKTIAHWSTYVAEIEKNLAILDALDGNCGNQAFADTTKTDATRYGTLAGVLAADMLWLKADATSCSVYLAVEADATGFLHNSDCGGRAPGYDVMQETYSLVAAGAVAGVSDGVTPRAPTTTGFPYLDAPH